jgi:D-alanine-D-alanine ligase
MSGKINLAILFGGQSCEHAVSVVSARSVLEAVDKEKYQLILIGITEEGQWQYAPQGDFESLIQNKKVKPGAGLKIAPDLGKSGRFVTLSDAGIEVPKIDVAFPVLHGTFGEDGVIQGLLELADVAYVGCPLSAAACGMDKVIAKRLFDDADIPQADHVLVLAKQWTTASSAQLDRCDSKLRYPLFIKPASLGSSVGISKAHTRTELQIAIEHALEFDEKVLVESSFEDCAEVECAVLGNDEPEASVVGEIVAGAEFYDYEAKYLSDVSETHIPADISKESAERVRELSIKAFQAILGKGLSRVDFFVSRKTGEVWLNEINTMPGFTPISMYPKLWQASDLPYAKLIDKLVQLADERHVIKKNLKRSY